MFDVFISSLQVFPGVDLCITYTHEKDNTTEGTATGITAKVGIYKKYLYVCTIRKSCLL